MQVRPAAPSGSGERRSRLRPAPTAPTVDDLTLASALVVTALAIAGLSAHELDTQRVVHKLEVHEARTNAARTPTGGGLRRSPETPEYPTRGVRWAPRLC
jgi:hypothetical protein